MNDFRAAAELGAFGSYSLLEYLLVMFVLVGAVLHRSADSPAPLGSEGGLLARLSSTPQRMTLAIIIVAILARGLLLPFMPAPVPIVPDEFSLLLQAETFAQGRLVNPPHRFAAFFETMYVNQVPAYASMYFPGRSLPLLAGILITGHPFSGVWLTMIVLAVATAWMLRAYVSPPLALFGGLLVIVRFGIFNFWINSYFGGALTALGGVLLIGAFERLRHRLTVRQSIILATGVLLLLVTRPFEGFLFALPFALAVSLRLLRPDTETPWRHRAILAIPSATALLAGLILLGTYNLATTGAILKTPYDHNRLQYAVAPAFFIGEPNTPQRALPTIFEEWFVREGSYFNRIKTPTDVVTVVGEKTLVLALFYVGPAMFLPFAIGLGQWRRFAVPLAGAAGVVIGFYFTIWDWAQYSAPAFGAFMVAITLGIKRIGAWRWRGRATGAWLSRALPLAMLATLAYPVAALATGGKFVYSAQRACCLIRTSLDRADMEKHLLSLPGNHLVLVRFDRENRVWENWIANAPDIDRSRIIWAHDLGPAHTPALIDAYPQRRLWQLDLILGVPPKLVEMQRPG
jgi:hypothetical protein